MFKEAILNHARTSGSSVMLIIQKHLEMHFHCFSSTLNILKFYEMYNNEVIVRKLSNTMIRTKIKVSFFKLTCKLSNFRIP